MDKIEIKNSSTKPIEGVVPSKEYSDYTIKSTQIEDNVKNFLTCVSGHMKRLQSLFKIMNI